MKKRLDEDDIYFNAEGMMVFTAEYLLQRNFCCGNGCLHCPFEYKNVTEPKRSRLLAERNEKNNEEGNTKS